VFKKFFAATFGIGTALILLTVISYSLYFGGVYAVLKYENKQAVQAQSTVQGVPSDVEGVPEGLVGTSVEQIEGVPQGLIGEPIGAAKVSDKVKE
jgi:hypothetical protein